MKTMQKLITALFLLSLPMVSAQYKAFEVTVSGKGQPILLFPGFTCTGEVWAETVAELSKTYECHVFTFAGFGDVAAVEKPWLPKIKTAVQSYTQEKQLEDPIIIGHSLGGTLGLWLTVEDNHPYSQLIVVDALPAAGALMIPNFNGENIAYESPWNRQLLEMEEAAFEQMAGQMASGMVLDPEKHPLLKDWIVKADRETYVYGYTDLMKLDLRQDIAKIDIPVHVLAATHPYGLEMAKNTYASQYAALGKYSIAFAENAGHFIMYDRPIWFLDYLKKHL